MEDWNAAQYLKYEAERTQPARDLAAAVDTQPVARALDVGCGPGNSTRVLAARFPDAELTGADFSADMLAAARAALPKARFVACDISGSLDVLGSGYDLVFSNACLQWVPHHEALLPRLFSLLRVDGTLAVQVPVQDTPIHAILSALAESAPYSGHIAARRPFYTLDAGGYYPVLRALPAEFRIWQTTYCHVLPSHTDILEWYRGTGLRPYLAQLPQEQHAGFEAEVLRRVRAAYPAAADGHVLFPFPRLFFTACRRA